MGGYVNILSVYGNSLTEIPMNDIVFRYLHVRESTVEDMVNLGQDA